MKGDAVVSTRSLEPNYSQFEYIPMSLKVGVSTTSTLVL